MRYLNNAGTRWKPDNKEKVLPLNRFKNGNKVTNLNKPLTVKFYEQAANFAIANFNDGSYSTDYKLIKSEVN